MKAEENTSLADHCLNLVKNNPDKYYFTEEQNALVKECKSLVNQYRNLIDIYPDKNDDSEFSIKSDELGNRIEEFGLELESVNYGLPETESPKDESIEAFKQEVAFLSLEKEMEAIKVLSLNLQNKGLQRDKAIKQALVRLLEFLFEIINKLQGQIIEAHKIEIEKSKRGPKAKKDRADKQWVEAKEYFIEEIPNHHLLNDARKEAARRAGIHVQERRLIEKLPDPRKKHSNSK